MPSLVMTLIGSDHPGLVDALATTVVEHGGNWLESRMSRLAGKFAGILRVTVPEARAAALRDALGQLESHGLHVVIERTPGEADAPITRDLKLELVGRDHPGIVRGISHALAGRGVNIEELETGTASAAMSGETLFRAAVRLGLPSSLDVEELRHTLEDVAGDLMVDIELDEAAPPPPG